MDHSRRITGPNTRSHVIAATFAILSLLGAWVSRAPVAAAASAMTQSRYGALREADLVGLQSFINLHTDQFGGLYFDQTGVLNINITASNATWTEDLLASKISALSRNSQKPPISADKPFKVKVQVVQYSTRQLQSAMSEVTEKEPWASQAKSALVSWGIDPRLGKLVIGVTAITPEIERAARLSFGDMAELVQEERPRTAVKLTRLSGPVQTIDVGPQALRSPKVGLPSAGPTASPQAAPIPSRLFDLLPYYGGDRIYRLFVHNGDTYLEECTVAFMWTTPGMSTAGHCGPTGTIWTQGYYDENDGSLHNSGRMGINFNTEYGNNRIDAALMNGSSWVPWVYNGWRAHEARPVASTYIPIVGKRVCYDGSFTGENCKGLIEEVNKIVRVHDDVLNRNIDIVHLDKGKSTDGSVLCQSGDSGGPVYSQSSAGVSAAGNITATPGTSSGTCWFTVNYWMGLIMGGRPQIGP